MNAILTPGGPQDEGLLELETLLIPALCSAAQRRWQLREPRLFWKYDPSLKGPLSYGGPDYLALRGADVPRGLLVHSSALVLLRYIPSNEPGLYDLLCHGLAADLAWEVAPHLPCQAPTLLPLARELLQVDPDLALRIRALSETPPATTSVAPVVFDRRVPEWLRRRLRHAALLTETPTALQARREAGAWRWLGTTRFEHLFPALINALEERTGPSTERALADQT